MANKPITPEEMRAYVDATWEKCQAAAWQEEIDDLRTANAAFAKRQEWWNDRMFEMEAELQRYKKSAAMWRNKAYEASGHPLPWKPDELWQGLTDDDIAQAMYRADAIITGPMQFKFAREIEAKLKEKNG